MFNSDIKVGLGYIFKLFINIFIIISNKEIIKRKPDLQIHFIIFFIGSIIFNLAYNVQIIGRMNNYLLILRPFLLTIIIWHYFKIPKFKIISIIICSLYFLLFLISIYKSVNMCSPYNFSF